MVFKLVFCGNFSGFSKKPVGSVCYIGSCSQNGPVYFLVTNLKIFVMSDIGISIFDNNAVLYWETYHK